MLALGAAAQPVALPGPHGARLGIAADTLDTPRRVTEGTPLPDEWLARDKALHLGVSFLATLSSQYVWVDKGDLSNGEALSLSVGSALALGLAKEVLDARRPRDPHFCWRDLAADAAGVALAAGLISL